MFCFIHVTDRLPAGKREYLYFTMFYETDKAYTTADQSVVMQRLPP